MMCRREITQDVHQTLRLFMFHCIIASENLLFEHPPQIDVHMSKQS